MAKITRPAFFIFLFAALPGLAAAQQAGAIYKVHVKVVGLGANEQIVLQDNASDALDVSSDGNYTFRVPLADASGYSVGVTPYSPSLSCVVTGAAGTVRHADITSIVVSCTDGASANQNASGQNNGSNPASSAQLSLDNNQGNNSSGPSANADNSQPAAPAGSADNSPNLALPQNAAAHGAGGSSAPTLDNSAMSGGDLALPTSAAQQKGGAPAGQNSPNSQQAQKQGQSQQPTIALKPGEPTSFTFYNGLQVDWHSKHTPPIYFAISSDVVRVDVSRALPETLALKIISTQAARISGMPSADSPNHVYKIVAYNQSQASKPLYIHIAVKERPAISTTTADGGTNFTFYKTIGIKPIHFTLTGDVSSVKVTPSLPSRMSFQLSPNGGAGVVIGTPTVDGSKTYSFVAYNNAKIPIPSKPLLIRIKVVEPPMMGDPGTEPMPISVSVNTPSCSLGGAPNHAFTQLPGQTSLFIGRDFEAKYPNNPRCYPTLGMFNMSFTTAWGKQPSLTMIYTLLPDLATLGDGYKPNGNFDPYVAMINGTYWVAWQCEQWNEPGGQPLDNTGVCLGPLAKSGAKYQIDLSRSALVAANGSDPKILYWNGQIYLYWTDIKADKHYVYESLWEDGTKMAFHGSMLCPSGTSGCRISGNGGSGVYETMVPGGHNADTLETNITADVFATMPSPTGKTIYVIAGVGGNKAVNSKQPYGCVGAGRPPYEGCYKARISKTTDPLDTDSLNQTLFDGEFSTAPFNEPPFGEIPFGEAGEGYTRFAKNPHGHIFLHGSFINGDSHLMGMPLPENKFFDFQNDK